MRPGLELDGGLLLGLTVVQVGGVEGDGIALLDVPLGIVHHDVVVSRALLKTLSGGGNLVALDPHSHGEGLVHRGAVLGADPVHAVLAILGVRAAGGEGERHRRADRAAEERATSVDDGDGGGVATLGRLGAVASEEILYPELTRCVAMRGAEVIVHSTSEVYSAQLTPKAIARRARAQENLIYIVSANSAGIHQTDVPVSSTDGGSELIDYRGLSLANSGPGESMTACAEVNLGASRLARARMGMSNTLARQRFEAYRAVYQEASVYPPNTLSGKAPSRAHFSDGIRAAIEQLSASGVIEPLEGGGEL